MSWVFWPQLRGQAHPCLQTSLSVNNLSPSGDSCFLSLLHFSYSELWAKSITCTIQHPTGLAREELNSGDAPVEFSLLAEPCKGKQEAARDAGMESTSRARELGSCVPGAIWGVYWGCRDGRLPGRGVRCTLGHVKANGIRCDPSLRMLFGD